jgi:hypothetical protein
MMDTKDREMIPIVKASGEKEYFDASKLRRSLENSGAGEDIVDKIVSNIRQWIVAGVSTREIYSRAFSLLHAHNVTGALRYRLKQALLEFGNTGYPFEHFVGEIYKKKGFHSLVGQVVEGRCITHEMDVVATKDKEQCFVECKYSKDQGKYVSIQVPLYVRSRVDDIIMRRRELTGYEDFRFVATIVTNTRFSSDSIEYSKCSNLQLLGWDYPHGNGLKELIEKMKIFPVTLLSSLSRQDKEHLLSMGLVTCHQLSENPGIMSSLNLQSGVIRKLQSELDCLSEA